MLKPRTESYIITATVLSLLLVLFVIANIGVSYIVFLQAVLISVIVLLFVFGLFLNA